MGGLLLRIKNSFKTNGIRNQHGKRSTLISHNSLFFTIVQISIDDNEIRRFFSLTELHSIFHRADLLLDSNSCTTKYNRLIEFESNVSIAERHTSIC